VTWVKLHAHSLELLAFSLFLLIQPRIVGASEFTAHDWDKVGLGALMLVVAYVGANTNATVGQYAKQVGVVGTAVLVSADNLLDGPWSTQKTMQVVVAGVVAFGALLGSSAPKAVLPGKGQMGDQQ
jgi:peptidoglycan/LPS O-acetylase OafA/YrhL